VSSPSSKGDPPCTSCSAATRRASSSTGVSRSGPDASEADASGTSTVANSGSDTATAASRVSGGIVAASAAAWQSDFATVAARSFSSSQAHRCRFTVDKLRPCRRPIRSYASRAFIPSSNARHNFFCTASGVFPSLPPRFDVTTRARPSSSACFTSRRICSSVIPNA
jgi:hypothetical protein